MCFENEKKPSSLQRGSSATPVSFKKPPAPKKSEARAETKARRGGSTAAIVVTCPQSSETPTLTLTLSCSAAVFVPDFFPIRKPEQRTEPDK